MPSLDAATDAGTMPRPPSNSVQIAIRVPAEWLTEADEIAKLVSRPGLEASRTDAFRAAIARGFQAIREESAASAPAPKKPTRSK